MSFPKRQTVILVLLLAVLSALGGCKTTDSSFTPYMVRLYMEESQHLPASHVTDLILPVSGSHITVRSKPVFGEWDIVRAAHFETEFGPAVMLLFTSAAATDLYRTTINHQGRRLVLTINGVAVGGRYIDAPIEDGRIAFFLEIDDNEVPQVAEGIQRTSTEIQKRANKNKNSIW